jgi:hypothetical protein
MRSDTPPHHNHRSRQVSDQEEARLKPGYLELLNWIVGLCHLIQ